MDFKEIFNDKKKTMIIVIAAVLIIVLVTTALILLSNNSKKTTSSSGGTTNKGTLVYWGLWEPASVMTPLIEEFESANPGVKIQYSQQTFTGYESRLYTRLQQTSTSSEPAPDIFRIHNTWLPRYRQYLSALPSSIMSPTQYSQAFYPTALKDFTGKDNYIYAIPLEIDGLMVFYNKQLLKSAGFTEPPQDWDSFIEAARKMTKRDSSGKITQAGAALGTSRNIKHSAEILSFLLLQEGVDIIDSTRTKVALNNSKAIGVFETYTNFATGKEAVWSSTLMPDLDMFYSGKLAMMIAPSWRAFDIIQSAPTVEFGTAPLPQLKANENEIYYATYWGDAVNRNSANTELAWKFIKFLSEKEQQMKMYSNSSKIRAFGEPYSLVELNSEMKGKTYVDAIAKMAPYMQAWQIGDEAFVNSTFNEAVTKIVENKESASNVLREAENAINAKLAQTNK